jgi:Rap1a immunity proteins
MISASLALALTQAGPAWGGQDASASCRAIAEMQPSTSQHTNVVKGGVCVGIILGVIWGAIAQSRALNAPHPFCIPDNAPSGQLLLVVVKYIDQRPQVMHRPFAELAYLALKEAWPCKP